MNSRVSPEVAAACPAHPVEIDDLPLPYLELDAQGVIVRANRMANSMRHPGSAPLVGSTGWDNMADDQKQQSLAAFKAFFQSGDDPVPVTRPIFDRSGTFRVYRLHRNLIRNEDGIPIGMRVLMEDITELTHSLEESRREQQWLASSFASTPDAVILTDVLGTIRTANPAAQKIAGACSKKLTGMAIEEAFPLVEYNSASGELLDHRAILERPRKGTAVVRSRKGEVTRVEINSAPIVDHQSGVACGVIVILRENGNATR